MAINRGKEFEEKVSESLEPLKPKVDFTRLYDTTNGYKGVHNPADFIAYCSPTQYYLECKTTKYNTLPFSDIPQIPDLKEKSKIIGIKAGVIVWYIKHKRVFWVDIKYIEELQKSSMKSINIKDIAFKKNEYIYEIPSETSRIYPKMFFEEFFNTIKWEKS